MIFNYLQGIQAGMKQIEASKKISDFYYQRLQHF